MIRPVRPDGTIETGGVFVPVLRGRIVERLTSAARQRVVLIVAPAGYGKSVALRQFLDTVSERCVRFDVLTDHGTLLGFLRGFSEALADVAPDARATLPGAYEKNASSPSPGADLALWLHSHLKSFRGVIAIDDLHVAQDDREVTRFVASLIERTKGRVQWVIASRSTTGLPIGTWLAYGDSDLAIDEHDLKFSIEEAREAARAFRLAVRDDELYELLNVTDGWATAISFALRSSTRSVDLRNISSMTREMIYRYLAEQVYESLADQERRFIESCALLPEIDVELLTACGFDRAAAMLEELRARVAFISEREPGHFRLHDLFREFAMHQLHLRGSVEAARIRSHLAQLLIASGRDVEALRLLVDARAADGIASVLRSRGLWLVSHGYIDDVDAAVAACQETADDAAMNAALRGLIAIARGKMIEGERLLQRGIAGIDDPAIGAELRMRTATLAANRGEDVEPVLAPLLSDVTLQPTQRLEGTALLAAGLAKRGDMVRAMSLVAEARNGLRDVAEDEALARTLQRLGFTLLQCGELDEATQALKEAIEIATPRGLWSVAARAHLTLAHMALYSENSPSLALWNAQQAAQAATRAGDQYDLQGALLTILSIETRRGNAERAAQIERQLAELSSSDEGRARYIASSQAHRYAWNGQFADAHRLFGSILDRQPFVADRMSVHAFYALTLALDGAKKQSVAAAERAAELLATSRVADGGFGSGLKECAQLFVALTEVVNGRLTVVAKLLKRRGRFGDEMGSNMRNAVEDLARLAKNGAYISDEFEQYLEAIRDHGWGGYARYLDIVRVRIEAQHVPEPEESVNLTPSELRILRALARGLSPKEIAAEMSRSPLTIQTHIQNLNNKLGSHGRSDAIATAKRLGLLDARNAST